MLTNRFNKNAYFLRKENPIESNQKKWDERFFLEKIPPYDAYKDINYLSLGLMKSKIKYENLLEKEKLRKYKHKNPISQHYILDSQPKKTSINKKLIFSINNIQEKDKDDETKRFHSLTYKHRLNNTKSSILKSINNKKNHDFKYLTNYINDSDSNKLTMEENDLLEEFEIIKIMWNKFGVTNKYQENFVNFLNSLNKKESIRQFLDLEKKQMQKFKYDLTLLLKKIIHRNDEINNLKNLVQLYINILNEKKFHQEKNNENLESLSAKNEEKIISDLKDSLLTVRINTINVVNQIKNFSIANSYYFYMNKIDLSRIKNDYYYNDEYLLSIRNDLDFVQNSAMQNLYDFDYFGGGDPFFLSFTQFPDKDQSHKEKNERKLQINDKMLMEIQNCLFFLNQAQICYETKNNYINKNKIYRFLNSNNNINNNPEKNNANDYGVGSVFKGNLERNIIKLKMQDGYDKLFTFMPNKNSPNSISEKFKNSKKKNHNVPLMTSQQLKERFNEYELINSLIYNNDENKDNKEKEVNQKEDEYKKRDKEIMFQKIKDLEKDMKQKEKEKEEKKKEDKETKEKEKEKDKKELKKSKNEEDEYEGELDKIKKEEKEEEIQNKKLEEEKQNKLRIIEEEKQNKVEENEKNKIISPGEKNESLEVEIKEEEEEKKPEYIINWFTGSLEELTALYNDYLSSISQSLTKNNNYNFPEKVNYFITGIYPKIIIAKEKKENNTKINGICGINYYLNDRNKLILKINHISAINTNKDIINNFLDLIENTLDYQTIEIELNTKENKDNLYEILINKGFKEQNGNEDKIILQKESMTQVDNQCQLNFEIKYDSLSVLSLENKNMNSQSNDKVYKCFDNLINKINLSLLINTLKNDDKYKIEIINSSYETSLIDKFSKIENIDFDFIKSKNNNCLNIEEISNNEILPEINSFYAIINNCLNIQINTLMSYNIDNYLYNGIEINKNNLIKETKYMNNLYNIPTLNKNVNIIIYQYNNSFETDCLRNKDNIYLKFIELFKETINILKMNEKEKEEEEENNKKKLLWIPSFNINTNIFATKLNENNDIIIKNENNDDMRIKEFNEYLKINYLTDNHMNKSIKINLENENNIVIKDKFILGICHKEFMDKLDIPIISLVNVTYDNFIKA